MCGFMGYNELKIFRVLSIDMIDHQFGAEKNP
jgi:hypothetical protein